MRRTTTAVMLAMTAMLVFALPASATRNWCMRDPIVELNGSTVQIWVAIPEEYERYVNGPIRVTILTPTSVDRELVFVDEGFNGYGEKITWADLKQCALLLLCKPVKVAKDGSFDVEVSAVVPINKNLLFNLLGASSIPLQLTIVLDDGTTETIEMTNNGARVSIRVQGK
ncbi:MAG: hypothetical protein WD628_03825 [Thermomicrobiales bacterium]